MSVIWRLTLCDPIDSSPPGSLVPGIFPGKNTGVGCHFLLQCMKVKSEREVALSCSIQWPHGLKPTRLLHPRDFPGKSTGVGCHCLLWRTLLKFLKPDRMGKGGTRAPVLSWSLPEQIIPWATPGLHQPQV